MADITEDGTISRRSLLLGVAGAAVVLGGGAGGFDYELGKHPAWRARLFGCGSDPTVPQADYVYTSGTYASAAMKADVPWEVALPADYATSSAGPSASPLPLILVLPGRGGSPHGTVTGTGLPGWATKVGLKVCFATPGGAGSTYYHPRTDGTNCFAWVTEEFVPMVESRFHVGGAKPARAVYGSSMGGFGALLVGLKRPDLVSAAVAVSPAVFPSYHDAITGHPDTFDSAADWETWGFWNQADQLRVPTRIDCGDADPFSRTAQSLLRRIPGAVGGIEGGCHVTSFWRRNATTELEFLAARLHS